MQVFQTLRGKAITHYVPHTPTPMCEAKQDLNVFAARWPNDRNAVI